MYVLTAQYPIPGFLKVYHVVFFLYLKKKDKAVSTPLLNNKPASAADVLGQFPQLVCFRRKWLKAAWLPAAWYRLSVLGGAPCQRKYEGSKHAFSTNQ